MIFYKRFLDYRKISNGPLDPRNCRLRDSVPEIEIYGMMDPLVRIPAEIE